MSHHIQVAIVSDQPFPNLIPIANPSTRPEEVLLLVSSALTIQRKDRWLKTVIEARQWARVREYPVPAYDYGGARDAVQALLRERAGEDLALNVTGGTKVMALAAFDAFLTAGLPVFYVDTANSRLLRLSPESGAEPIPNVLDVGTSLEANGYRIHSSRTDRVRSHHMAVGEAICRNPLQWQEAVTWMNQLASRVGPLQEGGTFVGIPVDGTEDPPHAQELVSLFERAGVLRREGRNVRFANAEGRFFANGGWLEAYIHGILRAMKTELGIVDIQANVKVETEGGVRNEFDLAFTAHNSLYLVECKAGRGDLGNESVYKMDSAFAAVGGPFGHNLWLSFHPPSWEVAARSRERKIRLVTGEELQRLSWVLRAWVGR